MVALFLQKSLANLGLGTGGGGGQELGIDDALSGASLARPTNIVGLRTVGLAELDPPYVVGCGFLTEDFEEAAAVVGPEDGLTVDRDWGGGVAELGRHCGVVREDDPFGRLRVVRWISLRVERQRKQFEVVGSARITGSRSRKRFEM